MQSNDKIIELSKTKIVLLIIGAAVLAVLGAWIATLDAATLVNDAPFGGRFFPFNNAAAMHYIGLAGTVFFGACCLFGIYKFFDKKPGLVLGDTGFVDNASGVAAGFVPWADVKDVKTFQLGRQRMLIVMVRDPEQYMRRGNPLKRLMNRMNYNLCGSPIAIPSVALKIDFDQLSDLFKSYRSRYAPDSRHTPHRLADG